MGILQRILDSVVALVMIVLALVLQGFFFLLLGWGVIGVSEVVGHKIESDVVLYIIMGVAFLLFNGVAFHMYFRQRYAHVGLGDDTSAFFYIPRAIDTILHGSQRVSRSEGASDIHQDGGADDADET